MCSSRGCQVNQFVFIERRSGALDLAKNSSPFDLSCINFARQLQGGVNMELFRTSNEGSRNGLGRDVPS